MQNENTIKIRKQQGSHSKSKINQIKMWFKSCIKKSGIIERSSSQKEAHVGAGQVTSGKERIT